MKKLLIKILLDLLDALGWKPPRSPRPRVYVFAANYQHFKYWRQISHANPYDTIYVDQPQQLFGVSYDENIFFFYETWRNHPRALELERQFHYIKNKGV